MKYNCAIYRLNEMPVISIENDCEIIKPLSLINQSHLLDSVENTGICVGTVRIYENDEPLDIYDYFELVKTGNIDDVVLHLHLDSTYHLDTDVTKIYESGSLPKVIKDLIKKTNL